MDIKYTAQRTLRQEPVFIKTDKPVTARVKSVIAESGERFPAQGVPGGITAILSANAGEELSLKTSCTALGDGVEIKTGDAADSLDIFIDGDYFASYVYSDNFAKPYLGPFKADSSVDFTRLDFNATEHPHHRSLFIAVGDVNGVDLWNEPEDKGFERHRSLDKIVSGSACGSFTATNLWTDNAGNPLCDETRTFKFYAQSPQCRYVDVEVTFTAAYGDVHFGDTKEAGPLGIRMNEQLKVKNGGRITNSYGGIGEKECWGKPAHWCDYSGTIDGKEYGIAAFDNESNPRYPTTWHIRDYGLFAANNLFFRGAIDIPSSQTLTYRHRVVFHLGDFAHTAADRFVTYISQN